MIKTALHPGFAEGIIARYTGISALSATPAELVFARSTPFEEPREDAYRANVINLYALNRQIQENTVVNLHIHLRFISDMLTRAVRDNHHTIIRHVSMMEKQSILRAAQAAETSLKSYVQPPEPGNIPAPSPQGFSRTSIISQRPASPAETVLPSVAAHQPEKTPAAVREGISFASAIPLPLLNGGEGFSRYLRKYGEVFVNSLNRLSSGYRRIAAESKLGESPFTTSSRLPGWDSSMLRLLFESRVDYASSEEGRGISHISIGESLRIPLQTISGTNLPRAGIASMSEAGNALPESGYPIQDNRRTDLTISSGRPISDVSLRHPVNETAIPSRKSPVADVSPAYKTESGHREARPQAEGGRAVSNLTVGRQHNGEPVTHLAYNTALPYRKLTEGGVRGEKTSAATIQSGFEPGFAHAPMLHPENQREAEGVTPKRMEGEPVRESETRISSRQESAMQDIPASSRQIDIALPKLRLGFPVRDAVGTESNHTDRQSVFHSRTALRLAEAVTGRMPIRPMPPPYGATRALSFDRTGATVPPKMIFHTAIAASPGEAPVWARTDQNKNSRPRAERRPEELRQAVSPAITVNLPYAAPGARPDSTRRGPSMPGAANELSPVPGRRPDAGLTIAIPGGSVLKHAAVDSLQSGNSEGTRPMNALPQTALQAYGRRETASQPYPTAQWQRQGQITAAPTGLPVLQHVVGNVNAADSHEVGALPNLPRHGVVQPLPSSMSGPYYHTPWAENAALPLRAAALDVLRPPAGYTESQIVYRSETALKPDASANLSPPPVPMPDIEFIKRAVGADETSVRRNIAVNAPDMKIAQKITRDLERDMEISVNKIADKVYSVLERRLRTEKMRRGML